MKNYSIVCHDFIIGVDKTPAILDYKTYSNKYYSVDSFDVESFDTIEQAIERFDDEYSETAFTMEMYDLNLDHDENENDFCVYGWYYTVEAYGKTIKTSSGFVWGTDINKWKENMLYFYTKGIETKEFFYDSPHYTYDPMG